MNAVDTNVYVRPAESGIPMRRVHCSFCEQSFFSGRDDRCAACGKLGGLVEQAGDGSDFRDRERESWCPPAGIDESSAAALGCGGILAGALLGLAISISSFGETGQRAPVAVKADEYVCGLSGLADVCSQVFLGLSIGALGGGMASLVLLAMANMMDIRSRKKRGK